jgi:hypothetical protein
MGSSANGAVILRMVAIRMEVEGDLRIGEKEGDQYD